MAAKNFGGDCMSYISEIFDRAHIQHIREFLLHGVECVEISDRDYKQRLDIAYTPVKSMMHAIYPDEKEYEDKMASIYDYASAHEDVYMEIGLQCGILLVTEIFENIKNT